MNRSPHLPSLRCRVLTRALWLAFALVLCRAAVAAPVYVPARDDEVVETLRQRPLDAQDRAERQLRAQARREPQSLPVALHAAQLAIAQARRDGDPRELGLAQAALAPWWALPAPPPAVRLLRATVLQSRHDFAAALADLEALLAAPAAASTPPVLLAQAELTHAAVLQVLGRYAEATQGCERLGGATYQALGPGVALAARACLAELRSLRGQAGPARQALDALAAQAPEAQAGWLTLVRAELAQRLGDARAGALFRQALSAAGDAPPDVYPLAAYADWLLDQGRAREVAVLLQGREQADALLLRLAIAWQQLSDPRAADAAAELQQRFAATRARGDLPHLREEAMAVLRLQADPARALALASQNWALQKEPADALLLAQAAAAARQPEAAEPLRRFMRETGYADVRLARWLQK